MKRKLSTFLLFNLASLMLYTNISQAQPVINKPFRKIKTIKERFQLLPISAIQPTGWLKKQLQDNLEGFTGHLDSLAPDLIVKDDIYGTNRLTKHIKNKSLGAVSEAGDWQAQFLWWNSETQSNWWDGYIRTAILLKDQQHMQKIRAYVNRILATQDDNGYLGIYDKELRYRFDNENGELWSKTTLLRGLLAWYEFTNDKYIFLAVKRAVDDVMANYPIDHSHPFYSVKPDNGGLTHGLAFTDILEIMYKYTGKQQYLDYCLFLYKDFSEQVLNEDGQYKKLLDQNIPLKGHGVHTYEHLRSVAAAYYASGNSELKIALKDFLQKISNTTTPSGAPAGDEFIMGRKANGTTTGYEYCSLQELMDGYLDLLAKTGNPDFGDKSEKLFFNAAQGARHPTESAICYLKTDNAYSLSGGKNGDTSDRKQTRYRYSPVHKEAAVCCVPNAGRIGPSYIQHMWMKDGNALVATALGPCEITSQIKGSVISIKEITNYPFDNSITLKLSVEKPVNFIIRIRKPSWAEGIHSSISYTVENGFIVLNRNWHSGDAVTIRFDRKLITKEDGNDEVYFMYGPLVLSHSIPAIEKITKQFTIAGLKEMEYTPVHPIIYQYSNRPVISIHDHNSNVQNNLFSTSMYNPQTGKEENVILQPMGQTILRQVTFKKHAFQ